MKDWFHSMTFLYNVSTEPLQRRYALFVQIWNHYYITVLKILE